MNKKKQPIPTKPFFTRFLAQQALQDVTGGKPPINHTLKFPSDSDEV